MSPRRRALAAALVAGVSLAAVAAVVLSSGETRPAAFPPQDVPGPVLLVPGYGGATVGLEVLAQAVRATGRTATVVALPGDGTGDLRAAARALDDAADSALAEGAPSVDVVGYSAGGVSARLWVAELDGASKARRVVTIGSPHHGTEVAALGAAFGGRACAEGCRQLVPGSDLLDDLNSGDETPEGPQWLSLWTSQDDTVTPPVSARLEGAVNVQLQDLCPGIAISHGELPRAPLVTSLVLRALDVAPLATPSPGDCTNLMTQTSSGG